MQLETMLGVDEYARLLQQRGDRLELSRGLLVRQPYHGAVHGAAAARIYDALRQHAAHVGGVVLLDTAFVLQDEPPTVRGPDVALLTASRAPNFASNGFLHGAPDLAVELTFTTVDAVRADLLEKVFEYLEAGTAVVWVVDLATRTVTVYESGVEARTYRHDDVIHGTGVLQGFDCAVAAFLP